MDNPIAWVLGALALALVVGFFLQSASSRSMRTATTSTSGEVAAPSTNEVPGAGKMMTAKIYLVAIDNGGKDGRLIGCNDSLVAVNRQVSAVRPLRDSIAALLGNKNQNDPDSGLYNALYQSDVTLDAAVIENGKATLTLSGETQLGGTCDTPRVIEQIRETALQFPTVKSVEVTINGTPIEEALSQK